MNMRNRGVTLLELLVVVFIIALLTAAATRLLRPAMENSQVREAGRILGQTLGTARTTALESNRSSGILFAPMKTSANACMELIPVQVQPPYAGDSLSSRIRFKVDPVPVAASNPPEAVFTVEFPQSDAWTAQISTPNTATPTKPIPDPGLTLQFNHQGHFFRVKEIDVADANNPKLTLICSTIARWPKATPAGDPGMSFQFFRAPKPNPSMAVQLPVGSVVDLLASGVGNGTFLPTFTQPVMVTFNSAGQLDMVYSPAAPQGQRVTENVYFLIGRPEGAGNSDNLKDLRSVWVSIVCQTGSVGIAENTQVWTPGPDTKWGLTGTDDDGNGVIDDITEAGRGDDVKNTNADVGQPLDRQGARRLAAGGRTMGG